MLWPDKWISFNPYNVLGQPFQALDQLLVKIKAPLEVQGADLGSTDALCTSGCRCFHAKIIWIVLGYSPASHFHILWTHPHCPPSAPVSGSASHHCQTSRKPPFHLALCTALPRSASQGSVRKWKPPQDEKGPLPTPHVLLLLVKWSSLQVLVVSGLERLDASNICKSHPNCVGLSQEGQS